MDINGELIFGIVVGVAAIRADVLLAHIAKAVDLLLVNKGLLPGAISADIVKARLAKVVGS